MLTQPEDGQKREHGDLKRRLRGEGAMQAKVEHQPAWNEYDMTKALKGK